MATQFSQSIIGLEISEENIYVSQLEFINNIPTVTKVKTISIPPRSILDGIIADPENIADQIVSVLEEDSFEATNVMIAMNDDLFLKRCEQFSIENPAELRLELQNSIRSSILFRQRDFQLGFQSIAIKDLHAKEVLESEPVEESGTDDSVPASEGGVTKKTILYAALSTDLIDNLTELVKLIDKTLVSIDLISLSVLRAMQFNLPANVEPEIYCFVNNHYIDFNIVCNEKVLMSHVFRKPMEEIIDDEFLMDSYIMTFKQLLLSFSSKFPSLIIPKKLVYFSRVSLSESFFDLLSNNLGLELQKYDISTNLEFLSVEKNKEKLAQYSQLYLPGIGLCLKYFEPTNKTLNITKVKKQIAPVFNRRLVLIYSIVFAITLGVCFILNMNYTKQVNTVLADMEFVKNKIRIIQKGQTSLLRQKRVKTLQDSIDFLGSIKNKNESKYIFFYKLVETLPLDISFSKVSLIQKDNAYAVSISGQAFFKDSIYKFYDLLKSQYSKVDLRDIKSKYDEDVTINTFSVNFQWDIK